MIFRCRFTVNMDSTEQVFLVADFHCFEQSPGETHWNSENGVLFRMPEPKLFFVESRTYSYLDNIWNRHQTCVFFWQVIWCLLRTRIPSTLELDLASGVCPLHQPLPLLLGRALRTSHGEIFAGRVLSRVLVKLGEFVESFLHWLN